MNITKGRLFMKPIIKLLLILISASLSTSTFAYPEIPFCPAGGAPGWMNYIDYKRNQNRWQNAYSPRSYQQSNYPPAAYRQNFAPYTNNNSVNTRRYYPSPSRTTPYMPPRYINNSMPRQSPTLNYRN